MKIVKVSAIPMSAPVPEDKRHRTDLGTKVKSDATLIRIETDNGLIGIGAALGTPNPPLGDGPLLPHALKPKEGVFQVADNGGEIFEGAAGRSHDGMSIAEGEVELVWSDTPDISGRARFDTTRSRTYGKTPSLSRGQAADAVGSPCCARV